MCAMTQGTSSQQTNKNDKSEQIIVKLLSDNMESEGTIHVTEASLHEVCKYIYKFVKWRH